MHMCLIHMFLCSLNRPARLVWKARKGSENNLCFSDFRCRQARIYIYIYVYIFKNIIVSSSECSVCVYPYI